MYLSAKAPDVRDGRSECGDPTAEGRTDPTLLGTVTFLSLKQVEEICGKL